MPIIAHLRIFFKQVPQNLHEFRVKEINGLGHQRFLDLDTSPASAHCPSAAWASARS